MRGPARCMVVGILALVILSVTFIQFTQQGDESIFRHRFGGLGPKAGQPQGDATFRPPFQTEGSRKLTPGGHDAALKSQEPLEPSEGDIRLLIGIMSPFYSGARRQIIRNCYSLFPRTLPVDVVFVQGHVRPSSVRNADKIQLMQQIAVEWENRTAGDIVLLDCVENLEEGKTYEFLKKVGLEFGDRYTHVMKTDDDSFVNIPALVEVLRANRHQSHFYWGTTYDDPDRYPKEMFGSGYILGMDLVKWISTSDIPAHNALGYEDWQLVQWLVEAKLDDNSVVNRSAFAGYPWPDLGDYDYKQENEVRPFGRWTLVTHPLKEDFMWVETARWYLNLKW